MVTRTLAELGQALGTPLPVVAMRVAVKPRIETPEAHRGRACCA
jgi:hypothetical protein